MDALPLRELFLTFSKYPTIFQNLIEIASKKKVKENSYAIVIHLIIKVTGLSGYCKTEGTIPCQINLLSGSYLNENRGANIPTNAVCSIICLFNT